MALTAGDELRRTRLRRMKGVALGLLVFAAVIYLATLPLDHSGGWGYVNAMAEAGMVGALADWFAVTALFRHPLGIPIPHTALIPRKKDELAGSLQSFFADNFLTEDVVRERVTDAGLAARAGAWAREDANAQRLVREGVRIAGVLLDRVDDDAVATLASDVILPRLAREQVAPIAGTLLDGVVTDGSHRGLVDLAAREIHTWLTKHPQRFAAMMRDRAPKWAPDFVNQRVVSVLYWQAVDWAASVRDNPEHPTRAALDDLLLRVADDLQHDPAVQARAEALKDRLLGHPHTAATVVSLWGSLKRTLATALDDPDSGVHTRGVRLVQRLADALEHDAALQERVDGALADAAGFAVRTYGRELSSVISHTIQRWDGRQASRRIELYVGRDLQFIRINGTIVGALAGLVIHAVSQLIV
ncbi:DUF445 domain-containing protein [Propioniciclava soli]|uniref:DUF445 domain-containing protein n=1 Tax=Propioniciclava soli TaxID=2775081 RepID=UPI001E2EDE1F|nr:DUF445 domain-containing protein [Propioniciclava soli]